MEILFLRTKISCQGRKNCLHSTSMAQLNVLALLFPKFEEVEAWVPIDMLRRAQIPVTIADVSNREMVQGSHGMCCKVDCGLSDCKEDAFDALLIPGGPGVFVLENNMQVLNLIQHFATRNKWVATICAAPLLLKRASCLPKHFTAHACVEEELQGCEHHPVVVDGKIITSRGPGTAYDFAFELIQRLTSPAVVLQLKQSIHYE